MWSIAKVSYINVYHYLNVIVLQTLRPPLKAKNLNLWRFATFSRLKLSWLNGQGFDKSQGGWCVATEPTIHFVPFESIHVFPNQKHYLSYFFLFIIKFSNNFNVSSQILTSSWSCLRRNCTGGNSWSVSFITCLAKQVL